MNVDQGMVVQGLGDRSGKSVAIDRQCALPADVFMGVLLASYVGVGPVLLRSK